MNPEYRRILARMDYYNYQEGLLSRHCNQDGRWDDHNSRAREYVLKAVERLSPGIVTVLGSGWLLEFPLVEMLEKNIRINLVDIVHPPEVIKQVAQFDNVKIIEADISGGIITAVWKEINNAPLFKRMKDLDNIHVSEPVLGFEPGLVVSLNLVTQLEILPVRLLERKARIPVESIENFRRELQLKHINFLKKFNSVLITDKEEIIKANDGSISVIPTLLPEVIPGKYHEEWTWDFDLKGTDNYTSSSVMRVIAETFEP